MVGLSQTSSKPTIEDVPVRLGDARACGRLRTRPGGSLAERTDPWETAVPRPASGRRLRRARASEKRAGTSEQWPVVVVGGVKRIALFLIDNKECPHCAVG